MLDTRGADMVLLISTEIGALFFLWNFAVDEGVKKMAVSARTRITLACTECKQRNYDNMKNKKNDPERIELKKYCKFCHKHTVHKETK